MMNKVASRRKRIWFCQSLLLPLALLCLQFNAECRAAEGNLVVTGDFEEGAGKDGVPVGWKKGETPLGVDITLTSEAKVGKSACKLSVSRSGSSQGISQKLVVIPGETYQFGFAYKIEGITSKTRDSFYVALQYTGEKPQCIDLGLTGEGKSKGWTYYEKQVKVPSDKKELVISFYVYQAKGTVIVDAISSKE